MYTSIALLRGINVSGQKLIKMDQLRDVLHSTGLCEVRTYIQSGNVLFESSTDNKDELSAIIANAIKDHFGFDVSVISFDADKLRTVINGNPFTDDSFVDPTQPYVAFLSEVPEVSAVEEFRLLDFAPDRYIVSGDIVYIYYDISASKSQLTNNLLEKKLNCVSTMRNWKTVLKLASLSEGGNDLTK
jgi:uncharacterized protein (DUF1697 family)